MARQQIILADVDEFDRISQDFLEWLPSGYQKLLLSIGRIVRSIAEIQEREGGDGEDA